MTATAKTTSSRRDELVITGEREGRKPTEGRSSWLVDKAIASYKAAARIRTDQVSRGSDRET